MSKIVKGNFPADSLLGSASNYHFCDSFVTQLKRKEPLNSTLAGKAFFVGSPKWVANLFTLRNKIVRFFGLKTANNPSSREEALSKFQCEPGEQLGLFKVFAKNNQEVILGEDDKHLNFRVAIHSKMLDDTTAELTLSTTVIFKQLVWKALFFACKTLSQISSSSNDENHAARIRTTGISLKQRLVYFQGLLCCIFLEKLCSKLRAFFVKEVLNSSSANNRFTFSANFLLSPTLAVKPVCSCFTISGIPPASVATTGISQAKASSIVVPKPSV